VKTQIIYRLDYGPDDPGIRVQFSAGVKDFSLLHSVNTDSEAHTASYQVSAGVLSLGVKWSERETDYISI
jgi:hypothetical protein